MPVQRLNHAVLYVRDVERSVAFYTDLLSFRIDHRLHADGGKVPEAAFMKAEESTNDHDLAFMQIEGPTSPQSPGRRPGLAHLAWEVDTLTELQQIRGNRKSGPVGFARVTNGAPTETGALISAELVVIGPHERRLPDGAVLPRRRDHGCRPARRGESPRPPSASHAMTIRTPTRCGSG
ncbi:VOC family protein [Streptomyces sp. NPDC102441]|uniref:VOC family protein n=1 Tax=Streptomyces sp. NPDC102441 TaxID=3366176 RepID=UPI0037FC3F40